MKLFNQLIGLKRRQFRLINQFPNVVNKITQIQQFGIYKL